MKPFSDLACEMRDGMPVCNWRDRATTCLRFEDLRAPLGGGQHRESCRFNCDERLCLLAVCRMAQVFEAAREEAANDTHDVHESWTRVDAALVAVNANLEE